MIKTIKVYFLMFAIIANKGRKYFKHPLHYHPTKINAFTLYKKQLPT